MTDIAADGGSGAGAIPGMTGTAPATRSSGERPIAGEHRVVNGHVRADLPVRPPYGQVPPPADTQVPDQQPGQQQPDQQPPGQPPAEPPTGPQAGQPGGIRPTGGHDLISRTVAPGQGSAQTQTAQTQAQQPTGQSGRVVSPQRVPRTDGGPGPERGRTKIAEEVVEKIAGLAARQAKGVYSLGGDVTRALGRARERGDLREGKAQGVAVEMADRRVIVDLVIAVEYGYVIMDVATAVRVNVITVVERMLGLQVLEVNIAVDDVHLPDDEDAQPSR